MPLLQKLECNSFFVLFTRFLRSNKEKSENKVSQSSENFLSFLTGVNSTEKKHKIVNSTEKSNMVFSSGAFLVSFLTVIFQKVELHLRPLLSG